MAVIRKDLHMRKGKIAAQVAHASMKVILDMMETSYMEYPVGTGIQKGIRLSTMIDEGSPVYEWITGIFTKIVVYVNSLEELMDIKNKADELNIPNAVVTDTGRTEFHGEPTVTCIAIGPDESEKIDKITGDLLLL